VLHAAVRLLSARSGLKNFVFAARIICEYSIPSTLINENKPTLFANIASGLTLITNKKIQADPMKATIGN